MITFAIERRRTFMRIGVPKEIKVHEYRIGMIPGSVREAVEHGHEVTVLDDLSTGHEDAVPDGARLVQADLALRADLARMIRRHRPEVLVSINFRDSFGGTGWNHADHRHVGVVRNTQ